MRLAAENVHCILGHPQTQSRPNLSSLAAPADSLGKFNAPMQNRASQRGELLPSVPFALYVAHQINTVGSECHEDENHPHEPEREHTRERDENPDARGNEQHAPKYAGVRWVGESRVLKSEKAGKMDVRLWGSRAYHGGE